MSGAVEQVHLVGFITAIYKQPEGRDSSVGIATRHRLDGPMIES